MQITHAARRWAPSDGGEECRATIWCASRRLRAGGTRLCCAGTRIPPWVRVEAIGGLDGAERYVARPNLATPRSAAGGRTLILRPLRDAGAEAGHRRHMVM